MKIILYANVLSSAGKRLQHMVESIVPIKQIEMFTTVNALDRKLRQPAHGVAIAVLLAASRPELYELCLIKDLLQNIRIILILPDSENETTILGHKLSPRFISYLNGNFENVADVLAKILKHMHSEKQSKRR